MEISRVSRTESYPLVPVFLDLRLLGKIWEMECEANGEAKIEASGEHTTISQSVFGHLRQKLDFFDDLR